MVSENSQTIKHEFGWLQLGEDSDQDCRITDEKPQELEQFSVISHAKLQEQKKLIGAYIQDEVTRDTKRRNEQREMQTIKIFRQVEEMMIGTYRFERRSDSDDGSQSVVKKFVPIFPHFYLEAKKQGVNTPQNFNIEPK